jgi:hypothetical protein
LRGVYTAAISLRRLIVELTAGLPAGLGIIGNVVIALLTPSLTLYSGRASEAFY